MTLFKRILADKAGSGWPDVVWSGPQASLATRAADAAVRETAAAAALADRLSAAVQKGRPVHFLAPVPCVLVEAEAVDWGGGG